MDRKAALATSGAATPTSAAPDARGIRRKARLFLALWPTPRVRAALAACRDRNHWPRGAAATPDEKLHLTLHFIGALALDRVAAVADGLQVAAGTFDLRLDASASWPGGVAVLCPQTAPEGLLALHAALGERLHAMALPVEPRPYRPHVTLARRTGGVPPAAPQPTLHWRARSYVLVQSMPDGRYRVLRRYALA